MKAKRHFQVFSGMWTSKNVELKNLKNYKITNGMFKTYTVFSGVSLLDYCDKLCLSSASNTH